MNQLAQTNHKRHSGPVCRDCGAPMRLFGIEAHPTLDRTDLRTYVCSYCDEVQTEDVPQFPELKPFMPMHSLPTNNAFDAETTKILASAFDAAWEEVKTSNGSPAGERPAAATRELLAKHIMALAQRGERNPHRLIKNALRRLGRDDG